MSTYGTAAGYGTSYAGAGYAAPTSYAAPMSSYAAPTSYGSYGGYAAQPQMSYVPQPQMGYGASAGHPYMDAKTITQQETDATQALNGQAEMQLKMIGHQYDTQVAMIRAECERNCQLATNQFEQQREQAILSLQQQQQEQEMQLSMAKQQRAMSDKKKVNPMISLAAGGISGAVSKTITAPLEKVKLAIQNQDSNPRVLSGEMKRYSGMGDCFSRHISELGATSLWRGNVANCVRYVPTAAFNLMFKDTIKGMFPKYNKNTDFAMFAATQISSGALAGGLTNTLVYPLIYVRTVLGADLGKVKKYSSMGDCLMKTVKTGGVLSLYNGIGPSSVGIVVYRGVQFGLQDIIKAFNPYQKDVSAIGIVSKFIVAQIAVSASGIAAYPFDTMQRRLQIEASKPKSEQIYTGMGDCFSKILKAEGAGGFFKGALANVLRGTGAALVLVMYDEIMNAVERNQ